MGQRTIIADLPVLETELTQEEARTVLGGLSISIFIGQTGFDRDVSSMYTDQMTQRGSDTTGCIPPVDY